MQKFGVIFMRLWRAIYLFSRATNNVLSGGSVMRRSTVLKKASVKGLLYTTMGGSNKLIIT